MDQIKTVGYFLVLVTILGALFSCFLYLYLLERRRKREQEEYLRAKNKKAISEPSEKLHHRYIGKKVVFEK